MLRNIIKNTYYHTLNCSWIRARLGHTLGIAMHMKWWIFHRHCILKYSRKNELSQATQSILNDLHVSGGGVIAKLDVSNISDKVRQVFDDINPSQTSVAFRMPRDISRSKFSELVYKLLEEISFMIEGYYKSYFKPYFINIERNRPGSIAFDTSFGWHIDDNPKQIMKIFIYLNDVYEDNGAFRALNYRDTHDLLAHGFLSNDAPTRLMCQPMVNDVVTERPEALKVFEGAAGTVLMFDNNLIHKATAPKSGERLLIQIEVYPSDRKFNLADVKVAMGRELIVDFPKNPFADDRVEIGV